MRKTVLALTFAPVLFCLPVPGEAQKVHRVGALVSADQFVAAFDGFAKKMEELGYIKGKNIQYEFYNAKGDLDALKEVAERMVRSKPDLIVTSSTSATELVAKASAGTEIPVVFLSAGNPLKFVKSYASSGNNLTGISNSVLDLTEKRLELLKELAPRTTRVIALNNPDGINYEANLRATRSAAKRLGLELVEVNVTSSEEMIRRASSLVTRKLGEAVIYPPDAVLSAGHKQIALQAIKERLPSVAANLGSVHDGVLAAYAPDYFALGQQGAVLVDKILKGARPSDLPIEVPYKLHLVINLKTARAIGLRIPKEILLRTDEVIK